MESAMKNADIVSPIKLQMRRPGLDAPLTADKSGMLDETVKLLSTQGSHTIRLAQHPDLPRSSSDVVPILLVAFDLMNALHVDVHWQFKISVEVHLLRLCNMYLNRQLQLGEEHGQRRMEIHVDDPRHVPRQKSELQASRDETRARGGSSGDPTTVGVAAGDGGELGATFLSPKWGARRLGRVCSVKSPAEAVNGKFTGCYRRVTLRENTHCCRKAAS